jgi:hypothetical protein
MTAVPTEARHVKVGDRVRLEPHGTLWAVTGSRQLRNTVRLALAHGDETTWLVLDAREKVHVIG